MQGRAHSRIRALSPLLIADTPDCPGLSSCPADLLDLTDKGLLQKGKVGRRFVWSPVPDLARRLQDPSADRHG